MKNENKDIGFHVAITLIALFLFGMLFFYVIPQIYGHDEFRIYKEECHNETDPISFTLGSLIKIDCPNFVNLTGGECFKIPNYSELIVLVIQGDIWSGINITVYPSQVYENPYFNTSIKTREICEKKEVDGFEIQDKKAKRECIDYCEKKEHTECLRSACPYKDVILAKDITIDWLNENCKLILNYSTQSPHGCSGKDCIYQYGYFKCNEYKIEVLR